MTGSIALIRVVVIDDHEVVRKGVRALLEAVDDITICGEADEVEEAIKQVERHKPDVAVVDLRLRSSSGVEVVRRARATSPATAVVILTAFADDRDGLISSIKEGASACVLKDSNCAELIRAIRVVAQGSCYLDSSLHAIVLEFVRSSIAFLPAWSRDLKLSRLSPQERRVLTQIVGGATNAEIARCLRISPKTVKNHTTHILSKLELSTRGQAAAYFAALL